MHYVAVLCILCADQMTTRRVTFKTACEIAVVWPVTAVLYIACGRTIVEEVSLWAGAFPWRPVKVFVLTIMVMFVIGTAVMWIMTGVERILSYALVAPCHRRVAV